MEPLVGIIIGSDSDLGVMSKTAEILDKLEIPYEFSIISAHRTPDRMYEYARQARKRGLKAIIAGAGGAAHVPGMVAAMTTVPVIGVPIQAKALDGMDALFSICQMPPGIPVATVAINGALNAGILAAKIIATNDEALADRLEAYATNMKETVEKKAAKLESIGYSEYLKQMQLLLQQAGRLIQEPDLTGVDLNLPKNWDMR